MVLCCDWSWLIDFIGRVVPVGVLSSVYHEGAGVTPDECAEKMIYVTQCKVQELQGHFSSRPVVLIGWGAGALVACKVSQMEDVTAIVCLGFPTMGPGGSKDSIDEMLLELTTPVFFIVGSDSLNCNVTHLDVRDNFVIDRQTGRHID
jgi:regulatory NSL complex subunit 3